MKYKSYNIKLTKILNETQYQFDSWLNGNFEDDPLPYEINVILFCFSIKNDLISLNMSGGEHMYTYNQPLFYCPLELQFFFCKSFFNIFSYHIFFQTKKYRFNKKVKSLFVLKLVKSLIENYLKNNMNSPLINKKIYLGEMHKNTKIRIKIQNELGVADVN